jgi:hypothetical protein
MTGCWAFSFQNCEPNKPVFFIKYPASGILFAATGTVAVLSINFYSL